MTTVSSGWKIKKRINEKVIATSIFIALIGAMGTPAITVSWIFFQLLR